MTLAEPEPVTAEPARPVRPGVMAQGWWDVVFLHWRADPDVAAPFLPAGTRPDTLDGATYVGLIALMMRGTSLPGLPGVPYLGTFPEINVRLYSVDADGRRGVVFRSLDAARLVPVLTAQAGVALPYKWARMRAERAGDVVSYDSARRWPGPAGAGLRLRVLLGDPVPGPTELEHFVTARWGLHEAWHGGRTFYLPVAHPRWELRRAEVLELTEDLISAAGLPAPEGPPVSVLYAPGVPVRAGRPRLLRRRWAA